jgi:hypothetical protein
MLLLLRSYAVVSRQIVDGDPGEKEVKGSAESGEDATTKVLVEEPPRADG